MLGNVIGREREIERLKDCMDKNQAQLVILYGRRRIGKTFLINEMFEGRFDFKITGINNEKKEIQLRNFAEELSLQQQHESPTPKDWTEAFHQLQRYLDSLPKDESHVIFFDEMPWLDTQKSGFLSSFEHFWNDFGCAMHRLICIVCGSASSWLVDNIANNRAGLFNRQTCSISLQPFTLKETEKYLISRGMEWSRYDIIQCYMVMGGIPYYLSLLESYKTPSENIDNLFFRKRSELWNEFSQLYKTLFNSSEKYISIVKALSKKRMGLSRSEIIKETKLPDNGALTKMLRNLELSDFIRINANFGKKKETYYQLRDYFTMFYFRFIENKNGRDEHFWVNSYGSPARNVWAGLTYEMVCLDHTSQIKKCLGISGVLTEESAWSYAGGTDGTKGAQIDLVIDRRDHIIDLCEVKYSENEYVIDKEYEMKLRDKREIFREQTKTNKTLQIILITTYGIKRNKYTTTISGQVVMDDLFS